MQNDINNDFYKSLVNELLKYQYLGFEKLNDGTLLIGNVPHIAPLAKLHKVYPPLNNIDVVNIEKTLNFPLGNIYKSFLINCGNGLNVFIGTLGLYGLRKIEGRTIEAAWQPFSIDIPNTLERPKDLTNNFLIIGSYNYDGSKIILDNSDGTIYFSRRNETDFLGSWKNLEVFLSLEIIRISKLFDKNGKEIDENIKSTPW